jgi:tetratricopeptide (TPR) repeat protein
MSIRTGHNLRFRVKISLVFLGIFLSLLLVEITLRCAGAFSVFLQERHNLLSLTRGYSYRILCVGESTTRVGGDCSYPSQLERILNQRSGKRHYTVINGGVVGIDTGGLVARLEDEIDLYKPAMIVAMMGINDRWVREFNVPSQVPPALSFVYRLKTYKLARLAAMHVYSCFHRPPEFAGAEPWNQPDYRQMDVGHPDVMRRDEPEYKRYKRAGADYISQYRFGEAHQALVKACELNPGDSRIYSLLAFCAQCQSQLSLAGEYAAKAIEADPEYYAGYLDLASILRDNHNPAKAGEILKKAVALRPERAEGYCELASICRFSGKAREAEEYFRNALSIDPGCETAAAGLGALYESDGNLPESRRLLETAQRLRAERYGAATAGNFLKLQGISTRRGIALVIAQYPMRPLQQLRDLYTRTGGLIFVDNEGIFKDAVRSHGFNTYFRDMFAGDFGHCTPEGNRLLAGNIADAILNAQEAKP